MKKIIMVFIVIIKLGFSQENYYYENNQKITITSIDITEKNSQNIDYYKNNNGIALGVTTQLIVKLKENKSLETYLEEFNLTLKKTLGKNLYLLKTTNKNLTIEISNRLNEKKDIEFSHPDFIKKRIRR